ncbi:MAG: GntR family transcriptional regulator [Anaerolineae bacterium]|nr:GntR family transcriptional regulator [Anaerolineae bacterium]
MPVSDPVPLDELQIDRTSPVPIYHQVAQQLTALIQSGRLAPGQRLPSETELALILGISPMTARQSLLTLDERGLIRRQRGVGSFVSARSFERDVGMLQGFTDDMAGRRVLTRSRILRFERSAAPEYVIAAGQAEAGAIMLRVKRLRYANEQPVALQDAYFAGVDFTREALEATGSIYGLLASQGISVARGEAAIDAVAAESEANHLLNVPLHAPLLRTRLISWDAAGSFLEYTYSLYRADLYQLRARLGQQ